MIGSLWLKLYRPFYFFAILTIATPAHAFWFFHHDKQKPVPPATNNFYSSDQTKPVKQRLIPISTFNAQLKKQAANSNSVSIPALRSSSLAYPSPVKSPPAVLVPVESKFVPAQESIPNATLVEAPLIIPQTKIKIGIGLAIQTAKISVLDGAQIIDNLSGKTIANLPGQSQWILTMQNNRLVFQPRKEYYFAIQQLARANTTSETIKPVIYYPTPNNTLTLPGQNLSFSYTIKPVGQNDKDGVLAFNDRLYRGSFLVQSINKQNEQSHSLNFNVINQLDLENYLLSVVPSEMPSSWPTEALKAQAIAARSYAVSNLSKHGSAGYDLKDNTEDQVYSGVKSETESSNRAVNNTRGLILKYDGKPICAYFHSASGGSTETAEHVWHRSVPYLKAVLDFDQSAPLYTWTKNYSIAETESGLPGDIADILSIHVLARSPSGRAAYLLINSSAGSRIISGEAARKYFSLPSTNFNVTPSESAYVFSGKGFGHGLGLSQWGARCLAENGYNAAQILCYYYNDISIGY